MNTGNKITLQGVLQEGVGIGVKNLLSLVGAVVMWILTIWIPYINVGTTIAIFSIPIELSKGGVISPLFIFDAKYRQYMGEFFTLIGLMSIAIIPAMMFMLVPGIIISIGWSLAIYLLLDKKLSPTQAMMKSNQATYGYKWTIFGVTFVLYIAFLLLSSLLGLLGVVGTILIVIAYIFYMVIILGCNAVIYRDLTKDMDVDDETIVIVEETKVM
ncbi:hypothetical protein [Dysgonomonas sp. 520]|uniref:hypothetical protein n=1 Tax=Dysgonomonas sp. 520 TaxID=2302931 RepID=UPI0013D072B7|nr:hypothetical protein [Dysgonomonas sp. 520]NDW11096.1 hypothetical protein [Dysgonomonas sp. 520]